MEQNEKIYRTVRYGLLLFTLAFFLFAATRTATSIRETAATTKKLPIYCVKTEEKKVALSFDAAWGNGRYGKDKYLVIYQFALH